MGNQIRRLNPSTYRVKSQSGNGWYLVFKDGSEWKCECPDHRFRGVACKHIHAVKFSLTLREKVVSENLGVEELCVPETCKFCGSTEPEKAKLICFEANFRVNWLPSSSSLAFSIGLF